MRKIVCLILVIILCNSVHSQIQHKLKYEVKTNLFNLAAIGPSIGLEYQLKNNNTVMFSFASGKIDYGDFGGLSRYKTTTVEYRKFSPDKIFFVGPYLKNIRKQVYQRESYISGTIPIGQDRDFLGNGLSAGATLGSKLSIFYRFSIELNAQVGYGMYYNMSDKFNNIPSGRYLDARIALWLGYQF